MANSAFMLQLPVWNAPWNGSRSCNLETIVLIGYNTAQGCNCCTNTLALAERLRYLKNPCVTSASIVGPRHLFMRLLSESLCPCQLPSNKARSVRKQHNHDGVHELTASFCCPAGSCSSTTETFSKGKSSWAARRVASEGP